MPVSDFSHICVLGKHRLKSNLAPSVGVLADAKYKRTEGLKDLAAAVSKK
jgi:hypothetical protein